MPGKTEIKRIPNRIFEFPSKRGQEEMVGFALIIILVSVILLAFLGFSLSRAPKEAVKSYEAGNFIQAFLQYTIDCAENSDYFTIQELIFECEQAKEKKCSNEESYCDMLNTTLTGILDESWPVGENWPTKGYELKIDTEEGMVLNITKGDLIGNKKGASQELPKGKRGKTFYINFNVYA